MNWNPQALALLELLPQWRLKPAPPTITRVRVDCDWQMQRPAFFEQIEQALGLTDSGVIRVSPGEPAGLVFELPPLSLLSDAAGRRALFEQILQFRRRVRSAQ